MNILTAIAKKSSQKSNNNCFGTFCSMYVIIMIIIIIIYFFASVVQVVRPEGQNMLFQSLGYYWQDQPGLFIRHLFLENSQKQQRFARKQRQIQPSNSLPIAFPQPSNSLPQPSKLSRPILLGFVQTPRLTRRPISKYIQQFVFDYVIISKYLSKYFLNTSTIHLNTSRSWSPQTPERTDFT